MEPVDPTNTASTADLVTSVHYVTPPDSTQETTDGAHHHVQEIEINLSAEPGEADIKVLAAEAEAAPKPDLDETIDKTIQFAIGTTVGCCLPLGLVAMYFAYKARRLSDSGKKKEAEDTDFLATKLALASCCSGTVLYIAAIAAIIYMQS